MIKYKNCVADNKRKYSGVCLSTKPLPLGQSALLEGCSPVLPLPSLVLVLSFYLFYIFIYCYYYLFITIIHLLPLPSLVLFTIFLSQCFCYIDVVLHSSTTGPSAFSQTSTFIRRRMGKNFLESSIFLNAPTLDRD